MKSKSIIQICIFCIIFLVSFFVYKSFFVKKSYNEKILINSDEVENNSINDRDQNLEKNIIQNLEYKSTDSLGNQYIIKSEMAESNFENEDSLTLIKVSAVIYLYKKPSIFISSDYAEHNKENFNTNFYKNVKITYDDIQIESDNLDLIYNNNLISLYNITKAFNNNVELKADKIDFDMLTKDVSINMYKTNERIKIIYK